MLSFSLIKELIQRQPFKNEDQHVKNNGIEQVMQREQKFRLR